ncbi:uncharacterized protein LOC124365170 [Homalodisca vitripennis]|uniref:uncharacterized protein LOC124365170 n=1 Tax=Homalodisca vitripennis TaxID=197043 RepID=UPI001EEB0069|nr:uncharacterized protein LOC124365170 [Homalodisca vitripennis]
MSQLEKVASNLAVNYVVPHISGIPGVKKVVGFRESGVKKGSIAAMAQSYQGDVKAGSTFSRMQSESSAKVGGYARQQTTATSRHSSAPGTKPSSGKNSSGPKMSHTSNKNSSYKNKSGK